MNVSVEEPVSAGDDEHLRFFAVGDVGMRDPADRTKPSEAAKTVLRAIAAECRDRCDFGVLLGDNVYKNGVEDAESSEFFVGLLRSYRFGDAPLYVALGNHDYHPIWPSEERMGKELEIVRAEHQRDGLTRGRTRFYTFEGGFATFAVWDTNALVRGCEPVAGGLSPCDHPALLGGLRSSRAPFKIWMGHHPYVSNGQHGDAGDYEECFDSVCTMLWPGAGLKALFQRYVVGSADLMLSGHDHSMQAFVLGETAAVVSGAGAIPGPLGRGERRRESAFERGGTLGYAIVDVTSSALRVDVHLVGDGTDEVGVTLRKPLGGAWETWPPPSPLATKNTP